MLKAYIHGGEYVFRSGIRLLLVLDGDLTTAKVSKPKSPSLWRVHMCVVCWSSHLQRHLDWSVLALAKRFETKAK